ncbi:MAG: hypothetical protein LBR34_09835 [Prevotella sp.]|jgi:hypothetical protein|nr:hypothetical protein [Prevotella sp.]
MTKTGKRIIFTLCLSALTVVGIAQTYKVKPTVNWNNMTGQMTADHWSINDIAPARPYRRTLANNKPFTEYYKQVHPGIIRIMHTEILWYDADGKKYDREIIKTDMDSIMKQYAPNGELITDRIMLCIYDIPKWIGTANLFADAKSWGLTEAQEDEAAAFIAQLPVIMKELGYPVKMYEVFNEKMRGGVRSPFDKDYWRLVRKIIIKLKEAAPDIQVGGTAEAWTYNYAFTGFIDYVSDVADFISFHNYYGTGDGGKNRNRLTVNGTLYDHGVEADAGSVAAYVKKQGGNIRLETHQSEYQIVSDSIGDCPRRDHVGASWIAIYLKRFALNGLTGAMMWYTNEIPAFPNSATGKLFLWSRYLRGGIAESSGTGDTVELLPVLAPDGGKSVLLINRKDQKTTVADVRSLFGGKASKINGMRLDETTRVSPAGGGYTNSFRSPVYRIDTLQSVPKDVVLNSYGMVLLTDKELKY